MLEGRLCELIETIIQCVLESNLDSQRSPPKYEVLGHPSACLVATKVSTGKFGASERIVVLIVSNVDVKSTLVSLTKMSMYSMVHRSRSVWLQLYSTKYDELSEAMM